jgi:serine/threonine protein phosphatase PrpC
MSLSLVTAAPAAATPRLELTLGRHSERGRKAVQQDFAGAHVPEQPSLRSMKGAVVALADGIGSSAVSHVASQAAVRAVLDDYFCTSDAWTVKRSMQRVLSATNSWLHAQTQRGPYRHDHDRGYVCALTVLVLKGRTAHVFHAGDVRLYRLQGRALEQLTEDHRVWIGGGQSYLSRALGFREQLDLDYRSLPVERGDVFVLACDGVYEHLAPGAIADAVAAAGDDLEGAARALVAQAHDAGSPDNLSVQIVRVDALPAADAPPKPTPPAAKPARPRGRRKPGG